MLKIPQELMNQLKRQEGVRLDAYQDSLGNWTIGVGHTPAFEGQVIRADMVDSLLIGDLAEAQSEMLTSIPWVQSLDPIRYCVLWNMVFNMGIEHLIEFKNMLSACKMRNWKEASKQMMDSLWATQVKERADELSDQMSTGQWQNV